MPVGFWPHTHEAIKAAAVAVAWAKQTDTDLAIKSLKKWFYSKKTNLSSPLP